MNAQTFAERVDSYLAGISAVSPGACPGCPVCFEFAEDADNPTDDEIDLAGESSFSWEPCEACGSHLGGDRHPAHGLSRGELVHLDVCVDCLFYLAYGDVPSGRE